MNSVDQRSSLQTYPGFHFPFSLLHFNNPRPIRQIIIHRISARIPAVSQQNPFPGHNIIIIMVMPCKYSNYIFLLFHGRKHSGIQNRSTSLFHTSTYQNCPFICSRLIIFRQGNMKKGQGRYRDTFVICCKPATITTIPFNLVSLQKIISSYTLD